MEMLRGIIWLLVGERIDRPSVDGFRHIVPAIRRDVDALLVDEASGGAGNCSPVQHTHVVKIAVTRYGDFDAGAGLSFSSCVQDDNMQGIFENASTQETTNQTPDPMIEQNRRSTITRPLLSDH